MKIFVGVAFFLQNYDEAMADKLTFLSPYMWLFISVYEP